MLEEKNNRVDNVGTIVERIKKKLKENSSIINEIDYLICG